MKNYRARLLTRFRPTAVALEDRSTPATFTVNTFADTAAADLSTGLDSGGNISLRSALQAADNNPDADTIILPAGTYNLDRVQQPNDPQGAFGDLNVTQGTVTIQGAGSATTKIQAAFPTGTIDRILHVQTLPTAQTAVNVTGVTMSGGKVNQTSGFNGGGIQNEGGAVTLTDVVVSGNAVTISGGGNAQGGGILNTSGGGFVGNLSLIDSVVSGNSSTGGNFSSVGQGGGIYNASSSVVSLLRTKILNNVATGADFTAGVSGAGAGQGGGLFNEFGGSVTITDSLFQGNKAVAGASESDTTDVFGVEGDGGGAFLDHGSITTITGSTFADNTAQGGTAKFTGKDNTKVAQGGRGVGGGLYAFDSLTVVNSTFSGNKALGGTASGSLAAGSNATGVTVGGAMHFDAVTPGNTQTITNSTITNNKADFGGGLSSNLDPGPSLQSTIVAGNIGTDPDVEGKFVTLGNNLIGDTQGSASFDPTANNDFVGNFGGSKIVIDPMLAPLGNYGGPTPTHALLTGSPAIDAGALPTGGLTTDQRGLTRVVNGKADIGSVEFSAPVAAGDAYPSKQTTINAGVTFGVTAAQGVLVNDTDPTGGVGLTAVKATDPAHGTLTLFSDGSFNYTPDATFKGSDSFTYQVKDAAGNLSAPTTVTLQVTNNPPTISPITSPPPVTAGTAVNPVTITIGDESPGTVTLSVVSSSNPALVPAGNVTFGGTGTDRTATVTPVAGQVGTATITIKATDSAGQDSTTATFTVTVNPAFTLGLSGTPALEFRPAGATAGTLTATETGTGHTFTYTLDPGPGSTDNSKFTISGNKLLTATALPTGTYSVRVRVTDEANHTYEQVLSVAIGDDPALSLSNRTLTINGTTNNDTFAFVAGAAEHGIVLNGVNLSAEVADVDTVVFNGNGGNDSADLTATGTGNVAALSPTFGALAGSKYTVNVGGVATLTAHGGKSDTAYFAGSSGSDTFSSSGASATLTGALNKAVFANTAAGFGTLAAFGGASDAAALGGTAGNDTFVGTPTYAELAGTGFDYFAVGFGGVTATGGGGSDVAYLVDSAGNDTLSTHPTLATLTGSGYSNTASGFGTTVTYSTGGSDTAVMGDSAGNDTFVGTPTYSLMTGTGYANYALNFAKVTATGSAGGTDVAYLVDSPGNDTLTASGSQVTVSAPTTTTPAVAAYSVTVNGFDIVAAYGTNGGTNKKTVGTLTFQLFTNGY